MPIDRSAIDSQLREIGEGDRWWEHREFRDLPHILHADESITGIIAGKLLGARRPRLRSWREWILVATNQRLICLKQERFGRKQIEFAAGQVIRVHQRAGLRAYQITLDTAQGRYRLRIPKTDAFRFARSI
ncbi:MAG TPA: PH domain-containing protein, partial [Longimicrobium sp.]